MFLIRLCSHSGLEKTYTRHCSSNVTTSPIGTGCSMISGGNLSNGASMITSITAFSERIMLKNEEVKYSAVFDYLGHAEHYFRRPSHYTIREVYTEYSR